MRAARRLLERAAALPDVGDAHRLRLLPTLGRALTELGELERADALLSEAVARGAEVEEPGAAADGAVALTFLRVHTDPHTSHAQARSELEGALQSMKAILNSEF